MFIIHHYHIKSYIATLLFMFLVYMKHIYVYSAAALSQGHFNYINYCQYFLFYHVFSRAPDTRAILSLCSLAVVILTPSTQPKTNAVVDIRL